MKVVTNLNIMKKGNTSKILALLEMVSIVDHYFIIMLKDYHGPDLTHSIIWKLWLPG